MRNNKLHEILGAYTQNLFREYLNASMRWHTVLCHTCVM